MTTKITESVILTLANGEEIVVGAEEKCRPNNTSVITCDGPRCHVHTGTDTPVTVFLNDERVRTDPTAAPDAFARFIKVQPSPYEDTTIEFCGARCLKDWLTYAYIAPFSPREKSALAAAVKELVVTPPLAIDGSRVESISDIVGEHQPRRDSSRFDREPVSQADGLAA